MNIVKKGNQSNVANLKEYDVNLKKMVLMFIYLIWVRFALILRSTRIWMKKTFSVLKTSPTLGTWTSWIGDP